MILALRRFWYLDVIKPARSHPELDRDTCRRPRQGIGGPDNRSLEAVRPCDGLAGRRQRRPDAGRRRVQWQFARARKANQLPCGPSHRMESATPYSNETSRLLLP